MRRPGPILRDGGVDFSVVSRRATGMRVVLIDAEGRETERITLERLSASRFGGFVAGIGPGQRYGLRVEGPWEPEAGHRFDPAKLLLDPYATRVDGAFRFDSRLAEAGFDTLGLVPHGVVEAPATAAAALPPGRPDFIYEISVRSFTRLHPDVPEAQRGTVAALAHPAVIAHLTRLGVDTVELMPLTVAIDERHLPPLGLTNAWGYNPVNYFAPDPRLAPGGMAEIRMAVAALHAAGIRVLVDVVFNHTGESDRFGPTLSLRGLDNALYFRHAGGELVNDTGCGNTLALDRPETVALVTDSLRWFVEGAGVDGFRYDLATVLGRRDAGFDPEAPLLAAIAQDPLLRDLIHIAEPWDIGPGGYQVGRFPEPFGEWNDRYRDDVRMFWRGDRGRVGALATRLAGSSDVFASTGRPPSAGVNFVAAHDGMTLADCVAYAGKHNEANGENNRDGTGENHSWNHGVEGPSEDAAIVARRRQDVRAMLATLFLSRGTPMLTAGDEFGRSQSGNNNAYAQDNALTWLDWRGRDVELEAFVADLMALRRAHPVLTADRWLGGVREHGITDVIWWSEDGPMDQTRWSDGERQLLGMELCMSKPSGGHDHIFALFNAGDARTCVLPQPVDGGGWAVELASVAAGPVDGRIEVPARAVVVLAETGVDEPWRRSGRPATVGVSDAEITRLAAAYGVQSEWWEISGTRHAVAPDSLRAVLASLGVVSATPGDVAEAFQAVARRMTGLPAVQITSPNASEVQLTVPARRAPARIEVQVHLEDGGSREVTVDPATLRSGDAFKVGAEVHHRLHLPLGDLPVGRHRIGDDAHLLVAPDACFWPEDLRARRRIFGLTTHLYGVRREGDAGIGDFEALARLGEATGRLGGRLVGLNPLHHLFPQDRERASPYQPSDRRFLDPIYIDVAAAVATFGDATAHEAMARAEPSLCDLAGLPRVDYTRVWAARAGVLRHVFRAFEARSERSAFDAFVAAGGRALADHGLFQAIAHTHGGVARSGWAAGLATRDPAALAAFARTHAATIRFHLFLQWLADTQLGGAQARTRAAGAEIGLYRDLAVGTAFDGGEIWAESDSFAHGVSVGAPPDPFSADGQIWHLPPPNPQAWEANGLAPWFDVLAANMRHAGALRIDHILGFARLFFVPQGASGREGAYVRMPRDALIAATSIASHRAGCLVIGEDLGTGEAGLSEALQAAGILSTRVLWFDREGTRFVPPGHHAYGTATCLSTHDLPTFAGWRKGRDIEVDLSLGRIDAAAAEARRDIRRHEMADLAEAAGVSDIDGVAGVAAVHRFLGTSGAAAVLVQVEDLVGEIEPLNVPGTDTEWPNWRRRLAQPVEHLAGDVGVQAVVAGLVAGR